MGEKDLITPYRVVPGTSITVYESKYPQPGTVLLVPWEIDTDRKWQTSDGSWTRGTRSWIEKRKRQGTHEERPWAQWMLEPHGLRSGWILRALNGPGEVAYGGSADMLTRQKLSALFERISPNTKTWLEPHLAEGDPYRSPIRNASGNRIWVPWVDDTCIPWLVFEGSKLGLKFAAGSTTRSEAEGFSIAEKLYLTLERARRDPSAYQCDVTGPVGQGIRRSSEALGLQKLEAISMSAIDLYRAFAEVAKKDKQRASEAYHRILMYRFMKRRRLTPPARGATSRASDPVSDAIERRANLLQAYRLFVFNAKGCPVSMNADTLQWNGMSLEDVTLRYPTLPDLVQRADDTAKKWTLWLYSDVLEKPIAECQKIKGLEALAGMGLLG